MLRHVPGQLLTYVICPGILYGNGEWERGFHAAFAHVWQGGSTAALSILGAGQNCLPMVHVADLSAAVLAVTHSPPEQRYILMTDDTCESQATVLRAISESLGSGGIVSSAQESTLVSEVS
jgi:adenylate kinase